MSVHPAVLPLAVLCVPALAGLVILFLRDDRRRLRAGLALGGAALEVVLVAWMLREVLLGATPELRLPLGAGLELLLRADAFTILFVALSTGLWLVTTLYAVGYLAHGAHRSRFFAFFSWCVMATAGIAMADNLPTFFVFYELLTLVTWPLVVHRGTAEALRAGAVYLAYTLVGGAILFVAIAWLGVVAGPLSFTEGGALAGTPAAEHPALFVIGVLLLAGFGVKAALVPFHGWLPRAMVAPAPVSALLHAVAVVKAGAFGIVRVVYDVFGIELSGRLGLTDVLAVAASVTILYGSLRALTQDDLKRRLAWSTVSQVSYIALGTALLSPLAGIGGIVHLVHQGLMKITLFFCAGNLAERLHLHKVSELDGAARRMPVTMIAFTLAAFGMIGVPPMAGFISKWFIGAGAVAADQTWAIAVLAASTVLNAAYFLPIVYRAWFAPLPAGRPRLRREASWSLLAPPVITALLALLAGLFAATDASPLEWARIIAAREFGP